MYAITISSIALSTLKKGLNSVLLKIYPDKYRLDLTALYHRFFFNIIPEKRFEITGKLKDSKGKFGRVLGDIVVDGVNINKAMVTNYHAAAYFGQSKEAIEAVHMSNRTRLIELGQFTPIDSSS